MISVTVSPNGILQIRNDAGGIIHRRTIAPGRLDGATFITSDVSGEPLAIRTAAADAWTPQVIAAFDAALRRDALPVAEPDDQALLNSTLAQPGSVVRALAELQFEEANRVRTWLERPTLTKTQFVAALKAKMR